MTCECCGDVGIDDILWLYVVCGGEDGDADGDDYVWQ